MKRTKLSEDTFSKALRLHMVNATPWQQEPGLGPLAWAVIALALAGLACVSVWG